MKKRLAVTFVLLIMILSACVNKAVEPVAIDEKNDKCIQCNMAVADDPFATQLITDKGKVYTFDDLGCMFEFKKENHDLKIAGEFVRDYDSKQWIELDEAVYVYDEEIYTPMAYNVISFVTEKKALEFADTVTDASIMRGKEIHDHGWGSGAEMEHQHH